MAKSRSPNYPALMLSSAVEAARKLWDAEKRTAVSNEAAALSMGYKSLSGPARVAIGAMRQYGLIERAEKGHIRLSELAVKALHGEPVEQIKAISQAAQTPALFQELAASHMDASENAIRSYLITKKGFVDDGARKAARTFKDAMTLALPPDEGYTERSKQEKPQAMAGEQANYSFTKQGPDGTPQSGILSWTVPYGDQGRQITVQVRVEGERLKRAHIASVRRFLELAEAGLTEGAGDE